MKGSFCHIGFVVKGQPFVIPTSYCRMGDELVVHGSSASRMLRTAESGIVLCVCVTLVDGLVLARSAFHHSINYRSAMIFGTAVLIEGRQKKLEALRALSEHLVPGRWAEVRKPSDRELRATSVLALPTSEFSLKTRTGPPSDDEDDYELPVWAGVLPLHMQAGEAMADPCQAGDQSVPEYVNQYSRPRRGQRVSSEV